MDGLPLMMTTHASLVGSSHRSQAVYPIIRTLWRPLLFLPSKSAPHVSKSLEGRYRTLTQHFGGCSVGPNPVYLPSNGPDILSPSNVVRTLAPLRAHRSLRSSTSPYGRCVCGSRLPLWHCANFHQHATKHVCVLHCTGGLLRAKPRVTRRGLRLTWQLVSTHRTRALVLT